MNLIDNQVKQITIIDTFGFFFRSFYALPNLHTKDNVPTGLLSGFANLIHNIYLERENNKYVIFALEGGGINRRKILSPSYKQNRQSPPEELIYQLPIAISWIEKMGFPNISIEGYEADDIIASINTIANKQNIQVRIISADKDLYQLIDTDTFIYDPIKKRNIRNEQCVEKFGVEPRQFIDYQSIVGDSSDNVSGIKGIGPKGALKIIEHFGSIEEMYRREGELENVLSARLSQIVRDSKEDAFLSKKLVTLKKDLDINIDFNKCEISHSNPLLKIQDELQKYEISSILKRLNANINIKANKTNISNPNQSFSYKATKIISKAHALEVLNQCDINSPIAFDVESDALDTRSAKIIGFSFCFDGENGYYVGINHKGLTNSNSANMTESKEILELIFNHDLIGHNIKFDLQVIKENYDLSHKKALFDSMILAWLLDPNGYVGLDKVMLRYFNHKMISFSEVLNKEENFSYVDIDKATAYCCEDSVASYRLYEKLKEEFKNRHIEDILDIAQNMEFRFIDVLIDMESKGIKIDTGFFANLEDEYTKIINILSQEIYELANERFNINSPKQLGEVLFDKLGLQGLKKTKDGFSTDENTLLKLKDSHKIVDKILSYREFTKLLGTYIEPLLKYAKANPQNRIYTSFLQTGTATGRLSSKSPNLQNIPVRSEEGKKIRQGFVAKDGYELISVDYSQIELRLLAHFSNDNILVESFNQNKDIHLQTAIVLFGENDAAKQRHIAKSINFGLIYGMGARRLSETLGISNALAKQYIENYFAQFPSVREYLQAKREDLKRDGYVSTLLGRKRFFNFDGASALVVANYMREGVNTIFQGSAADLIKMSMLQIYDEFGSSDLSMLLQIHDELIFESPKDKSEQYAQKITDIMNNIFKLNVPLRSNYKIAKNWAELK